jgi:hypothetical protein
MRLPLWARIAIPIVVLAGVAAIIVAALLPREPVDPADAVESACRSAVQAELESHDASTRELSIFEVTTTGEDIYLVRGEVAFRDRGDAGDEPERRVQMRCTVRVENGSMQAPSIRFSEPLRPD